MLILFGTFEALLKHTGQAEKLPRQRLQRRMGPAPGHPTAVSEPRGGTTELQQAQEINVPDK